MSIDGATGFVPPDTVQGDLQEQLVTLREELLQLRLATNDRPRVAYVPRERKVKPFSGRGEVTVQDFLADVESLFRARAMSDEEQCDFMTSHLEGDARQEIRFRPVEEVRTATCIRRILLEVFGEKRSVSQLQELFYLRKQADGEGIRSFAGALQQLMEALLRKDGHAVNQPDRVIAEHFAEGLKDRVLRREVKQQHRLRPQMSFVELREEAIQWSEEEERPPQSSRRQTAGAFELVADAGEAGNVTDLQRVLSELEKQQHVIEALTERVERMEGVATDRTGGRRSNTPQRPWSDQRPASAPQNLQTRRPFQERRAFQGPSMQYTPDGQPICYRCGGVGHLSRQCRNEASTGPRRPQTEACPPGVQTTAPTAHRREHPDDVRENTHPLN